jgi:hypothetical protein
MKTSSLLNPLSLVGLARMEVKIFYRSCGQLNLCLDSVRLCPSSAGFTASPIVSSADLPVQPSPIGAYSSSLQFGEIRQWVDATLQDSSSTLHHPVNPPSPAGTTDTKWSELTADAGESVANLAVDSAYHGDWMSLPFRRRAAMFQLAE